MEIKSMSKYTLRTMYGVSRQTFVNWLKPIVPKLPDYNLNAKLLTPAQVRIIVAHLGSPSNEWNE